MGIAVWIWLRAKISLSGESMASIHSNPNLTHRPGLDSIPRVTTGPFLLVLSAASIAQTGPASEQTGQAATQDSSEDANQVDPTKNAKVKSDQTARPGVSAEALEEGNGKNTQSAPAPGQASALVQSPDETNGLLWIPRILFFPLRLAFLIPGYTVEGLAWFFDRYRVRALAESIFFNEDGTFGVFPTVVFQSGFGINYGARMIYRDFFGNDERLALTAGFGGQFQQVYSGSLKSGQLFGERLNVELRGNYERQPIARFFGVGNNSELIDDEDFAPEPLLDPNLNPVAVDTRYGEERGVARLRMSYRVAGSLRLRFQSKIDVRRFSSVQRNEEDFASTDDVYDVALLTTWNEGQNNILNEAGLVFDNRRTANRFISDATPSEGFRLEAFGGFVQGFNGDPSQHWRIGTDLTAIVDLFHGDRNLVFHLYSVGVTNDLDEVPFTALPTIGGTLLLRGYNPGRFRDRLAAVGSVEYQYALNSFSKAYAFVDAGRVWRRLDDLSLDDLNLGYGFGFQAHTQKSFLMRFDVSGSSDGLRVALSFNPLYEDSPTERL